METWIALITLIVILLAHIIATVWWASQITTVLHMVKNTVTKIDLESKLLITKIDLKDKLYYRDQRIEALEKKLDSLFERIKC